MGKEAAKKAVSSGEADDEDEMVDVTPPKKGGVSATHMSVSCAYSTGLRRQMDWEVLTHNGPHQRR
ncbi:MAG: hypothetical protein AB7O44_33245 [Hyphomicrobiaceae bacterium]